MVPTSFGLVLRATDLRTGGVLDRSFDRFPIRIGRSALNDLQLAFSFVSHFHVVIGPHQVIDFASVAFAFEIGPVQFRFSPVPVTASPADGRTDVLIAVGEGARRSTDPR